MEQNLNKELFVYWVEERENVRIRKESGLLKPWSTDPVFQTTYFCNVDRENDRVTEWIRDTFIPEYMEHSAANMMMARFVNKPDSLLLLGWPWTYFADGTWRYEMSQPGAWGSAYIVSTNGRAMPKHDYIAGLLEQAFEQLAGWPGTVAAPTLASAHRRLQALQGMGSFMAAQVIADLKNTKGHPLSKADDWFDFAAPGPGSLRGLAWFHEKKVTPANFTEALASARQWCNNRRTGLVQQLCNQNLQNCFCEYDKYMRVSTGAGRSKRKYHGV